MIPEIVDEAIEELEARLDAIRTRVKAKLKRNPWYVKDRFNVGVLLEYVKEQRAREPLYQGYNIDTRRHEARSAFAARYGRLPAEIIIKGGAVLAGPITKAERDASR